MYVEYRLTETRCQSSIIWDIWYGETPQSIAVEDGTLEKMSIGREALKSLITSLHDQYSTTCRTEIFSNVALWLNAELMQHIL